MRKMQPNAGDPARFTEATKETTKRNRYASLKTFFNHIRNTFDFEIQNPCDTPILIKIFNEPRPQQWKTMASNKIFRIRDNYLATCKGHANPWLYSFLG